MSDWRSSPSLASVVDHGRGEIVGLWLPQVEFMRTIFHTPVVVHPSERPRTLHGISASNYFFDAPMRFNSNGILLHCMFVLRD